MGTPSQGFRQRIPVLNGGVKRENDLAGTEIGISSASRSDILGIVTKRLIEVDDEKLASVRILLGTTTLKSTVDAALDEVLALDQRRRALLAEHGHEDPLEDPARRQAAWR